MITAAAVGRPAGGMSDRLDLGWTVVVVGWPRGCLPLRAGCWCLAGVATLGLGDSDPGLTMYSPQAARFGGGGGASWPVGILRSSAAITAWEACEGGVFTIFAVDGASVRAWGG